MLPRTLEPEVMETAAEAADYDAMDHSEVNRLFIDAFLRAAAGTSLEHKLRDAVDPPHILDVGTGTALIPIKLCQRGVHCHITAIDLSREMLKLADRNVATAGLESRIHPEYVDAKQMPWREGTFDAVISNSIIHHIPEPRSAVAKVLRVLKSGGLLFVRDLLRPDDAETLERLVQTYAGNENAHQQQMFRDSLHAALTLDEVRALLADFDVPAGWASQTSDRHWTVAGVL